MLNVSPTQKKGYAAEIYARELLKKSGLVFCEQNFRCKLGEIDIIMKDKEHLVFVEVRYREKTNHGSGIESISRSKQNKLIKTALYYLQENKLLEKIPCRFDVVGVTADLNESDTVWIKDAFQA